MDFVFRFSGYFSHRIEVCELRLAVLISSSSREEQVPKLKLPLTFFWKPINDLKSFPDEQMTPFFPLW
jgi:hypothetical protein